MRDSERKLRARFWQTPLAYYVKDSIVRYVRALDDPDMQSCFHKLWSVLEQLTVTGSSNYNTTIRRLNPRPRDFIHGVMMFVLSG